MQKPRTFVDGPHQRLDQKQLGRLRRSRHLSTRQVAIEAGIGIPIYNRLETGQHPDLSTVTVASLVRVADYLRIPVGALFTPPENPEPDLPIDTTATTGEDAKVLGALLHHLGAKPTTVALADSLDWTQERLHAALSELDTTLAAAGLSIFRESGRVRIQAALVDSNLERRVREHPRAVPSQRLVTRLRSDLIARAHAEPLDATRLRGVDERYQADLMLDLGLLVLDESGRYIPSPDVRDSLYPVSLDLPEGASA